MVAFGITRPATMRTPAGRNYETTLASLLRGVKGRVAGIPLRWQKGVLVCFALLLFSVIWGIGISLEAWLEQFIGSGVDESRLGVANVPLTLLPNAVLAGDGMMTKSRVKKIL